MASKRWISLLVFVAAAIVSTGLPSLPSAVPDARRALCHDSTIGAEVCNVTNECVCISPPCKTDADNSESSSTSTGIPHHYPREASVIDRRRVSLQYRSLRRRLHAADINI